AHVGYNCPTQVPSVQTLPSFPQQSPCCEDSGVTREPYNCQPKNHDYYNQQNSCFDSNSFGFDQSQPQQYSVNHPIFTAHNDCLDSQIQLNSTLAKITEQMTSITSFCEMACNFVQKKLEEKQLEEEQAAKAQNWKLPVCCDDDDDEERSDSLNDNIISRLPSFSAITPDEPVLSTEEPDNSLSMGDEHLDTIPATESDQLIKSGVENLIPISSESEGIPEHTCDVLSQDNSPSLDVSKDQIEDFSESNEKISSTDDDSFSLDNIDYVEASPPDSELVSSEVMEIVIPEIGGIKASNDNPIPFHDPIISRNPLNLTPPGESEFFLEVDAFLAVDDESTSSQFPKSYLDQKGDMLLFEAFLNDDHSSDFKTESSSTSLNSLLEETNNFDNSLPESTTFSNVLCDAECESDSNDDQSSSDEDVLEKIVLKPLSEEEIIPMKSLHTIDSSLPISSKIDYLLDEFAGELTLLKSIPPGIDATDCNFEEDIRLIEKLLYDNSSPRPPKEFVSTNSDAKIKSFSPSPILVKDSDSLMKEIDLFCTPDYPMPPGIEKSPDLLSHRTNRVNAASAPVTAAGLNTTNSTNIFKTASPSDTAISPNFGISRKYSFVDLSNYLDDPDMNKKDERGIVIKNKARLVALGHTQEEGIDYDEVFSPVARIEAIRLFLAYAYFMGFLVYHMNVKSAFLYETIEEEVYVCQPPGFEDPDYPDKVNKVVKALYGFHQAPRSCTPIEIEKPLLKDPDGEDMDVYIYRSMIGSLMYLTSSRPDIRYLKGKLHLGLWYPRDSPFNLVACSDSDYAGASLDMKSTTGGYQFLGCRLISWQ
nr:retrovirus-related Pol polyprotein from transposon TNT 1-94 [Tanacetum cinerariifolium]